MAVETDPGFEGFPALWFYLIGGKLSSKLPDSAVIANGPKVSLSIWPRFLNAPGQALGSNDKTQFQGRGKPNAYLKVQVTQDRAGEGATKPLTWAASYPVLDGVDDDIGNVFFDDPVSGDPVEGVPIPGGSAKLMSPLTAVVGGPKQSKLVDVLDKVLGLASSSAGKALFPIPAADITLATNVESLINLATTAFAPSTRQQFWLNKTATPIRLTKTSDPGDDSLMLPKGTTILVAFQDVDGNVVRNEVNHIASDPNRTIGVNRGGELIATAPDGTVTNPFAQMIYVTYRATVADTA